MTDAQVTSNESDKNKESSTVQDVLPPNDEDSQEDTETMVSFNLYNIIYFFIATDRFLEQFIHVLILHFSGC